MTAQTLVSTSGSLPRSVLFRTTLCALALAARGNSQSLDWTLNPANGRWYAETAGPMSWTGADALARSLGGHLATVSSAAENAWLDTNFFSAPGLFRFHWIGLHQDRNSPNYSEPGGGWKWSSGAPYSFEAWKPGSPDDAGGHQDFARSTGATGGPSGLWQDEMNAAASGFGGVGDWYVGPGEIAVFNTASSWITLHQLDFAPASDDVVLATPISQVLVTGGVVDIDDFVVETGATLLVEGPNPLFVMARGRVVVRGRIDVSGASCDGVLSLNTTNIPELGAPGRAGGGDGGTGSPLTNLSSPSGLPGNGAFQRAGFGGGGGETGWSQQSAESRRRGAGGGGGCFGPFQPAPVGAQGLFDQRRVGLDAEHGFDNRAGDNGAISGDVPPVGGRRGPSPFVDWLPQNDFYGYAIDRVSGAVLVGELLQPWAGAGGGGGGDASRVAAPGTFPGPWSPYGDEKGAGGGGGGGACQILALGRIAFGPDGQIRARGGNGGGGENTIFLNRVGGGSGGGSGGHVVLQSAESIDLRAKTPVALNVLTDNKWAIDARGGQGGAGEFNLGGAYFGPNGTTESSPLVDACPPGYPLVGSNACKGHIQGAGGDGGPGVVQLHTPLGIVGADAATADILLPAGAALEAFISPLPRFAASATSYLAMTIGGGRGLIELESPDCDSNGVPDTFQLATNPGLDGDGDGIIDACDPTLPYCTPSQSSNFCVPRLRSFGSPSASATSGFQLLGVDLPGQRTGQIFYGLAPAAIPLGWNILCVSPPVQRMSVQSSGGTALLCDGNVSGDWNAFRAAHPLALGSPFAAGQTLYAQCWIRDWIPGATVFTDGQRFTLAP